MKIISFYRPAILVLIGLIVGFLIGRYTPSLKEIRYYTFSEEEKEIVSQLDLYEGYDFFSDLESIRDIIRNLSVSDVRAETLSVEEKEMIKELDLYVDYSFWKDVSENEILAVSKEGWEMMLESSGQIDKDIKEVEEGEK